MVSLVIQIDIICKSYLPRDWRAKLPHQGSQNISVSYYMVIYKIDCGLNNCVGPLHYYSAWQDLSNDLSSDQNGDNNPKLRP